MKVIMRTPFGSKLYGTATPESDTDFKGIFLPEGNDILLGKAPKSIQMNTNNDRTKNTSEDTDEEYFSLQYFLEMAFKGETIAIDMLHAPLEVVELDPTYGWIWKFIHANRSKFYTTDMKAYLGYVRKQASKYGVKGGRLAALREVKDFVDTLEDTYYVSPHVALGDLNFHEAKHISCRRDVKVRDVADKFPLNEFTAWTACGKTGNVFYEVLGRKYQDTMKISELKVKLAQVWEEYGERARQAERNENIDWKAMHHACRGGIQLVEIYRTGDLKYPLFDAPFLLSVKQGLEPFNVVQEYLEDLVNQVEILSKTASENGMPSKVSRELWDNLLLNQYTKVVNDG